MNLVISDQVHLCEFRSSDKPALIQHLNDRDIYDRTLRIPFPYTETAADEWLALYAETTEKQGRPVHPLAFFSLFLRIQSVPGHQDDCGINARRPGPKLSAAGV